MTRFRLATRFAQAVAAFFLAASLIAYAVTTGSAADQLAPFKDDLFAYPETVSSGDGGRSTVIEYQELRDINQRDDIPERRVKAKYVDTGVRRVQQDLILNTDDGRIAHVVVGKTTGARFITVYLHGQGGSRKQGVDDYTFGGNFNRIKNLMAVNGGLYLSPDFSDFGETGASQVSMLLAHYLDAAPGARLFVACGSMGGGLCWALANDAKIAPKLSGLLLLGSHWDDGFTKSAAFKRKVPVFFAQGSRDTVFPVAKQEAFFRSILKASPNYPTRFVRFDTGTHGTPIRMVDWRQVLNWMLATSP